MTIFVESFIGAVFGFLLSQAAEHGPKTLRDARKRMKMPEIPRLGTGGFFVSKTNLVNRTSELQSIKAILGETPHLRVMYFSGPGGVGKTRILEEVENIAKKTKIDTPIRWTGILDLYHPDMRSVLNLQDAIVRRLDPNDEYFKQYHQNRLDFESQRTEGLSGQSLDNARERLNNAFLQDYNLFSKKYRPVLIFDTLESLTTESDLIQLICQLEDPSVAARDWLLSRANHLNNTVILLAGRPQDTISHSLQKAYGNNPGHLEEISLRGMTREGSRQLLERFLATAPPASRNLIDQSDQLWELTNGLPVQLALITELVTQNENLDLLDADLDDSTIWGRRLVNTLFRYDNSATRIFFFLALARRGLTSDLLYYLEPGWSKQECDKQLANLKDLSVVKTRPGSAETFLHDALYELFDAYFAEAKELEPWYERLADYYRAQQSQAVSNRLTWGMVTVSLLYYELQRNPRRAFEVYYLRWDDIAIRGREYELDVQLRNELLRFFNFSINRERATELGLTSLILDQASAIRWVKRFVDQSNYEQAIDLAETILALAPEQYSSLATNTITRLANIPAHDKEKAQNIFERTDEFFWGQLLTYYGDALAFLVEDEARVELILDKAIVLLKSTSIDRGEPLAWIKERVLGRAYNTLGYLHRSYGQYGKALTNYKNALSHFETLDVIDEQATTLNNISFLLALLGDLKQAKEYVDRSLVLRQTLGQKYPLALGFNTRGRIYALRGQIEWGEQECRFALRIFQELESNRGIGLAYNALGFILRQQGEGWKINRCDKRQALTSFQQADKYLDSAAQIFNKQVEEPIRLWEALNERGSLYCDWSYLLQQQGNKVSAERVQEQAIQYQLEALKVAQKYGLRFQEADTLDDLAQLFADQGNIEKANEWLQQGLNLVPIQYVIKPNIEIKEITAPGDFYWLILGKANLQQGIWLQRSIQKHSEGVNSKKQEQIIECFALATVYYQRYWLDPNNLNSRLRVMARYLNGTGITFDKAKDRIDHLASYYNVDLTILLEAIKVDLTDRPKRI